VVRFSDFEWARKDSNLRPTDYEFFPLALGDLGGRFGSPAEFFRRRLFLAASEPGSQASPEKPCSTWPPGWDADVTPPQAMSRTVALLAGPHSANRRSLIALFGLFAIRLRDSGGGETYIRFGTDKIGADLVGGIALVLALRSTART
jgi:hypothetical protein